MNNEQQKAIYDVIWDYYNDKENGGKINIYLENLGDTFPDIRKKVLRLLKNKKAFKKGETVNIGMMAKPDFNLKGIVLKANSLTITVQTVDGQTLEFYTTTLNQKGCRDKGIFDVLFLRKNSENT